jgi:hypothetical protein
MKNSPVVALISTLAIALLVGCQHTHNVPPEVKVHRGEPFGALEMNDPKFFTLIAPASPIEKLASGRLVEGPVWFKGQVSSFQVSRAMPFGNGSKASISIY